MKPTFLIYLWVILAFTTFILYLRGNFEVNETSEIVIGFLFGALYVFSYYKIRGFEFEQHEL